MSFTDSRSVEGQMGDPLSGLASSQSRMATPSRSSTVKRAGSGVGNQPSFASARFHSAMGNSAIQQALSAGSIQAKLTIGRPGDSYEQEADRVAEQIVSRTTQPAVQRKCACEESATRCSKCSHETPTIQRKGKHSEPFDLSPEAASEIHSLRGGGQPLPDHVRDKFESHFGQDFSGVRIHTDSRAAALASEIGARAFTSEQNIAFGQGEYGPDSFEGQRLLAHELTHVVQQVGTSASEHELPSETLGRSVTTVEPDRVQADWLDDAKEAISSTYDSAASAVSGAYETAASGVSAAYEGAKSVAKSVGSGIAEGAKSAAKTVSKVVQAGSAAASGIADTISSDPEKTRSNLIARVNATRSKVQSADPDTITASPSDIASLNSKIGNLNVAMASVAPAIPLVEPVAVGLGEIIAGALTAIAAAIGISVGWLLVIIAVIILAIIALIWYLFFRDTKRFPDPDVKPKPDEEVEPKPEPKPKPKPKPGPIEDPPPPFPLPKPDCCPGPTPRGSFRVTDKRHPYFRPGVVEVKDNRHKHTRNILPLGAPCTASFLLSVVNQDPANFGPCLGRWIIAARAGDRGYGSQMGIDTINNYVDKVEEIILDRSNQRDASTWFGDTGETCGVNIAVPGVPVLTNNARIDDAPAKAHIIPEDL